MDSKTDLRLWAKSLRKTLSLPEKSIKIVENIRKHELYKSAKNVMLFYPTKFEIDLRTLFDDEKTFYLPRVESEDICVCRYSKGEELRLSGFKIHEPTGEPCSAEVLDLVIVPALAVDKRGYRLGYGGGFYDRFLVQCSVPTIVVIARELVVEELPIEEFDMQMDFVITD